METVREQNERKKEYLRSYKTYVRRIKEKEDDLKRIELEKKNPSAIRYSDMPHGSGSSTDLSDYMVACEKLEAEILKAKTEYVKKREEIMAAVHGMKNQEYAELLELKYIDNLSWKEVGKRMGFAPDTVNKKHGKALPSFHIPEEQDGK